jgi:hypothetical protein
MAVIGLGVRLSLGSHARRIPGPEPRGPREPVTEPRRPIHGSVRVLVDTPEGLVGAAGQVVELSEGGCTIRVRRRFDPEFRGRVNIDVAGKALWLPVIIRSAREDHDGWTVVCDFDRPTPEKLEALRSLLAARRRISP